MLSKVILIGSGVLVSFGIAYAGYQCKVQKVVDCTTYHVGDSVTGWSWHCPAGIGHDTIIDGDGTIASPLPTKNWFDRADSGSLTRTDTSTTCTFAQNAKNRACGMYPSHPLNYNVAPTKGETETAITLSGTCPPPPPPGP